MWKGLSVITNSPSPIVVVLSGSMEPAFQRGDLLFLNNRDIVSEPGVGDIVVYNVDGKNIPIVHRIIQKWEGYVSSMRRSRLLFTHLL
jgi:signal peptidase I